MGNISLTWIVVHPQERRWPSQRLMPLWPARRTRTAVCTMRVRPDFKPFHFLFFFFFWISRKLNIWTSSCSFRQAHHVCVRGQQRECWRNCSSPTDSPTVFVTSTLFQRPTTERQGLCTRDVEARPFFHFVYFVFFSISSLTLLSWDIAITSPL